MLILKKDSDESNKERTHALRISNNVVRVYYDLLYICYIQNIVRTLIYLVNKAFMTSQKNVYIYFFKKDLKKECESTSKQIKNYFLGEVYIY